MKVYLVQSLELDWDSDRLVEGIFSNVDKALEYIKSNFSFLEEGQISSRHSQNEIIKHYYGYLVTIDEIHTDENGDKYFKYEEDGEVFREYLYNQHSITITEWELDK